jgi:hypothetical protein
MQKAEQKAKNDKAKKKAATAPKKRVLPAQSTQGKASLKEVDLANAAEEGKTGTKGGFVPEER